MLRRSVPERRFGVISEAGENNQLEVIAVVQCPQRRFERDVRGLLEWVAKNAAGNRREGDAAKLLLFGEFDAVAITAGQLFGLVLIAAVPYRADRVDYVARL